MVNAIGLLGQVGIVRYHEDAGPLGQRSKMIDEVCGRFGIEVVARLIKDKKAGAFEERSGERNTLPLATGKEHAAFSYLSIVAIWEVCNEIVRQRAAGRRLDGFCVGVHVRVGDVFGDCSCKQHRILRNDADAPP